MLVPPAPAHPCLRAAVFWGFHGSVGFLIGGAASYATNFRCVSSSEVAGTMCLEQQWCGSLCRQRAPARAIAMWRGQRLHCAGGFWCVRARGRGKVAIEISEVCPPPLLCSWTQTQWILGYGYLCGSVWFLLSSLAALLEQANPMHC